MPQSSLRWISVSTSHGWRAPIVVAWPYYKRPDSGKCIHNPFPVSPDDVPQNIQPLKSTEDKKTGLRWRSKFQLFSKEPLFYPNRNNAPLGFESQQLEFLTGFIKGSGSQSNGYRFWGVRVLALGVRLRVSLISYIFFFHRGKWSSSSPTSG